MDKAQNEITAQRDLLDSSGHLTAPGWSRQPLWLYDRKKIRASALRIKEWDYYYVLSPDLKRGITFTLSDLGYAGLMAVCWLDFEKGTAVQEDTLAMLPLGKLTSCEEKMSYHDSKISLDYEVTGKKRKISVQVPAWEMKGELFLEEISPGESMNIATSWKENRSRFYYNRKINCLIPSGKVKVGNQTYEFTPENSSGGLDWGRGAWTYVNRWYWGSASGFLKGQAFGFNLGYGFSDRSPASENMVFYQGKAHKLREIEFIFDKNDYKKPWKIISGDKRFEMDFTPQIDRYSQVNLMLIKSVQHQVFGRFNGSVVLDDGTILQVKDFLGFAEDVFNRW